MFVLNPDPYLLPCYRISPFNTKDLHTNNAFSNSNSIDAYFDDAVVVDHLSFERHCCSVTTTQM